jgi:hypothetical protein
MEFLVLLPVLAVVHATVVAFNALLGILLAAVDVYYVIKIRSAYHISKVRYANVPLAKMDMN